MDIQEALRLMAAKAPNAARAALGAMLAPGRALQARFNQAARLALTDEETALFEEWASSKSAPASWPAAPPRTLHEVAADAAPEAPRISERRKALIARALDERAAA